MNSIYQISAYWDPKTGRWTALSDDIPGLVVEAADFRKLCQDVEDLVPQLLSLNEESTTQVPINIIANHSMILQNKYAPPAE